MIRLLTRSTINRTFKSCLNAKLRCLATEAPKKLPFADSKPPIYMLKARPHFEALTPKEKLYAHHMSKAAHAGTRIVLRQVSPESEDIFDVIMAIHKHKNGKYVSNEEKLYLEYASMFLSNLGNYRSFGDSKFVPAVEQDVFKRFAEEANVGEKFERVKDAVYSPEPNLLGYEFSGYYNKGVTKEVIEAALDAIPLMNENSRLNKVGPKEYEFKVASAQTAINIENNIYQLPGDLGTVKIVYGDHNKELEVVAKHLEQAKKNSANDFQEKMLREYIESFRSGDLEAFKKSQVYWVKDIGPSVEVNVGFIETYRDPRGVRAEWEGLVAMVNKERTEKFQTLVNDAPKYIEKLPWGPEFEKEGEFKAPDFTSLEVLTFAGSGVPAGINIPNYDDIRADVGFKNVSLGNVLSAGSKTNEEITFLSNEDQSLYNKYFEAAFEMQVGVHELLGHGTGRLFTSPQANLYYPNSDIKVETYYQPGQTWGSLFGSIAASYEECRAELVAVYLSRDQSILNTFASELSSTEQSDLAYVSYIQMARAGLLALEFYDPKSSSWGQAHMQARYSILQCLLQTPFVSLESSKADHSDLILKTDKSKLDKAHEAISKYLQEIHCFKSAGDFARASELYHRMTSVGEDMGKFRDIVLEKKKPRKQLIQGNTVIADEEIKLVEYEENAEGMIQSFFDRNL